MSAFKIHTPCTQCRGDGIVETGGVQGSQGTDTCPRCLGVGHNEDAHIEDLDARVNDLEDKINDVLDKCDDILEAIQNP